MCGQTLRHGTGGYRYPLANRQRAVPVKHVRPLLDNPEPSPLAGVIAQLQAHDKDQTLVIAELRSRLEKAEEKIVEQAKKLNAAHAKVDDLHTKLVNEQDAHAKGLEGALEALERTKAVILDIRKRGAEQDTDDEAEAPPMKRAKTTHADPSIDDLDDPLVDDLSVDDHW
ncbi:hypothetical protein MIND_01272600 [Mycena indigotica]|uniref:Uncharacterized protein n=1 Tax=Mycena indigotica TaxID=2126181 RepID=A0A8H6VRF5_9AGAR|nr:uncharacterized protein MIND_01272600 [Mycena indigotica]KAF7291287.1 hypothetical protein MIND_01272600 [Mycena indigotica]